MISLAYRTGYEYQLVDSLAIPLPFGYYPETVHDHAAAPYSLETRTPVGACDLLVVARGYAWDGPSGPTIDTDTFMLAALAHDVLYQMMRNNQLDPTPENRLTADRNMRELCIRSGMWRVRAAWCYYAVRMAGADSAFKPREVISIPYDLTGG